MSEESAPQSAESEWLVSLVLARYVYGETEWAGLDPEERNAIAEPYLPRARKIAPMVEGIVAGREVKARSAALIAASAALSDDMWTGVGPDLHLDHYPACESIRAWLHGRADREAKHSLRPAPAVCPECHNTDPDACGRCIREADDE